MLYYTGQIHNMVTIRSGQEVVFKRGGLFSEVVVRWISTLHITVDIDLSSISLADFDIFPLYFPKDTFPGLLLWSP